MPEQDYVQEQITPEQAEMIRNQRAQRLAAMNIPMPIGHPAMSPSNNKVLNKILEIRKAMHRPDSTIAKTLNAIESRDGIPEILQSKRNIPQRGGVQQAANPNRAAAPPLAEFAPIAAASSDMAAIDSVLNSAGLAPTGRNTAPVRRGNLALPQEPEDGGASFVNETRNKFHARMAEKQMTPAYIPEQPYAQYPSQYPAYPHTYVAPPAIQSGMVVLSEEDLKKKIVSIASQVAKKIIEDTLNSYISKTKKTVTENTNPANKIEFVKDNVVRIDGKLYKLVPATVATKPQPQTQA